jgi:hypothetical protein
MRADELDVVDIEWLDPCSPCPGWWPESKAAAELKPALCRSVGYLYENGDDENMVLVGSFTDSGDLSDPLVVPRSLVRRVKYLKRAKK